MSFGLFRTIWITLRASNYTTRAFEDTIRGIRKLERQQLSFKMNAAKNMFAVGTMYLAFGVIAVGVLGAVMKASRFGQTVMENFGKRVGKSMEKLSIALATILKPILNIVATILEFIVAVPIFSAIAAGALFVGTVFLLVAGITKMFKAAVAMLGVKHLATAIAAKLHATSYQQMLIPATNASTAATIGLGHSLLFLSAGFGAAFAAVFIVYQVFGKLPAIILGVVIALVALLVVILAIASVIDWSAGVRALAGAGIAGAIGAAAIASMPEHQMGTSFVRQGGFARVHAGEEIISARESKVQPRWQTTQDYRKSIWNVTISMGDVHTKADEETMIPLLRRALKEELDNKV